MAYISGQGADRRTGVGFHGTCLYFPVRPGIAPATVDLAEGLLLGNDSGMEFSKEIPDCDARRVTTGVFQKQLGKVVRVTADPVAAVIEEDISLYLVRNVEGWIRIVPERGMKNTSCLSGRELVPHVGHHCYDRGLAKDILLGIRIDFCHCYSMLSV